MTLQYKVGEFIQHIVVFAFREDAERLTRAQSEPFGLIQSRMNTWSLGYPVNDGLETRVAGIFRGGELTYFVAMAVILGLQCVNQRQRDKPLAEVVARSLANGLFRASIVKDIVNYLERNAQIEAKMIQRISLLWCGVTDDSATLAACCHQACRFAGDTLKIGINRKIKLTRRKCFQNRSFTDGSNGFREKTNNARIIKISDNASSAGEEIIAKQDSYAFTPVGIHRWNAAPGIGMVDDVVMDQCCQMDHLKGDTYEQELLEEIIAKLAGEQGQGRAQALTR